MKEWLGILLFSVVLAALVSFGSFAILGESAARTPGGSAVVAAFVWFSWSRNTRRTRQETFAYTCGGVAVGLATHLVVSVLLG